MALISPFPLFSFLFLLSTVIPTAFAGKPKYTSVFVFGEALGLPFLPPSLSHNKSFSKGANFAVAGATALDLAFYQANNITTVPPINSSLSVQLGWFEALKPSLCNTARECKELFKDALFIIGEFGGNDYNFLGAFGISLEQIKETYVPKIVKTVSMAIEKLINEGVSTVVVAGNIPSGCLPRRLTQYASKNKTDYDPRTGCLKEFNHLNKDYNTKLRAEVEGLRRKYSHARFIYADYYTPLIQFATKPAHFGFSNGAIRACCGGGGPYNYNASALCGLPGATACKDPSTYVNWDGIHLTEAANKYIATTWLKGPYAHPPILSH